MMTSIVRNASTSTKLALAAVIACIASAVVYGFAASFGIGAQGLAAGDSVVASCGTGVTFAYTTAFNERIGGYVVDSLNLSNIPSGCLGKSVSVAFQSDGTNALGSAVTATLPASGTTQSIPIVPSSNTIDAGQVNGVSVVIS